MMPPSLEQIDRDLAERSLAAFVRQGWHAIDPAPYSSNWHIDAVCAHLEAVASRDIRRLLINVPPRTTKSSVVSVAFPAWVWAQNPDPREERHGQAVRPGTWMGPGVRFLNASHAGPLAIRDSMRTRRLMQGRWYRGNWGERVVFASDQNAKQRYENTAGGARIATSVGGQLIGEGGDIITIDDPHNTMAPESETQREEVLTWWFEGMSTRLNDQRTGAFVVIMQRLHERDLSGAILAREMGWDHLCLPMRYEPAHPHPVRSSLGFKDPRQSEGEMLWPERFPHEAVDSLSTKLGAYGTAGQLQQRPTLREGGLFKRSWFKTVGAAPAEGRVVRCWDLAATADTKHDPDYTAGLRMKRTSDGRYFIEHVERFRGTPLQVERAIRNTAEQDPEGTRTIVPQDPGQAGKAQAQRLVSLLEGFDARARAESGTKDVRATPFAAQCEAGNVFLVKGPWNEAFVDEITTFPLGAHDDQVDAASGAFAELAQPVKRPWSQAM